MRNISQEQELVDYLQTHDETCPNCQYSLKHLTCARCPECGSRLALRVGVTMPLLWPWALIGSCFSFTAGPGLIYIIVISQFGMILMGQGFVQRINQGIIFYFIASIPAAVIAMTVRRRFIRLPEVRQVSLAMLVVLTTVLSVGGWLWIVAQTL